MREGELLQVEVALLCSQPEEATACSLLSACFPIDFRLIAPRLLPD